MYTVHCTGTVSKVEIVYNVHCTLYTVQYMYQKVEIVYVDK